MNRVGQGFLIACLLFPVVFMTACGAKSEVTQTGEVTESELHETAEKIQAMYGERGYLGPMTEEVELLTEEELQKLNPNGELRVDDERGTAIYGRFNKKEIRNAYDAREAAYQALNYVGIQPEKDTFLYGEIPDSSNTYVFPYYYKGVLVSGIYVYVTVDNGNTWEVKSSSIPKEGIKIASVEPEYKDKKLQARLEERYGECTIIQKQLWLCRYEEGYELEWDISIYVSNSSICYVRMNANTGEILGENSEEDVY